MNISTGIHVVGDYPSVTILYKEHVEAIQQLASACWGRRRELLQRSAQTGDALFVRISGNVLQVDVDRCEVACSRTRASASFFVQLLGPAAADILARCQDAYDLFYVDHLEPAAKDLFRTEALVLQPGRKLLLSGAESCAQLLHVDSLWPTLVGNVYLRPARAEHLPIPATRFPEEPGARTHPRDLRLIDDAEFDATIGKDSEPWERRRNVGPDTIKHNHAVLFCGNIVHGGPAPTAGEPVEAEPRIVMFQLVQPASSPTDDLSDYQNFEFSLFMQRYGCGPDTYQALRRTKGRWREHYIQDKDIEFGLLSRLEAKYGERGDGGSQQ